MKKVRFKKEKVININKDGSEKISGKPTKIHGKSAPVSLRQKMKSLWQEFNEKQKDSSEIESIADAQDFDVSREEELRSPYEVDGELEDALNLDAAGSYAPNAEQAAGAVEENKNDSVSEESSEQPKV